jgi:GH25 family lysozyme M1 (1,4-beta-N-acetylmuramidase)
MATMPLPPPTPTVSLKKFREQICPHCGSKDIHRYRARDIIERHVVRAFSFYPHWCADYDRRFCLRLLSWVFRVSAARLWPTASMSEA